MQTFVGRAHHPMHPMPEDLDIRDVAHSLAYQCRFAGHTPEHYSVAQHCVLVSYLLEGSEETISAGFVSTGPEEPPSGSRELAYIGLMHDAAEAYVIDLPRPVKYDLELRGPYARLELLNWLTICERWMLPVGLPSDVTWADNTVLATEARDIMGPPPRAWATLPPPMRRTIRPWEAKVAERVFLERFEQLGGRP